MKKLTLIQSMFVFSVASLWILLLLFSLMSPEIWGFTKIYTIVVCAIVSMWPWSIEIRGKWLLRFLFGVAWTILYSSMMEVTPSTLNIVISATMSFEARVFAIHLLIAILYNRWLKSVRMTQ